MASPEEPVGRAFRVMRLYSNSEGQTTFESLPIPGPVVSLPWDPVCHVLGDIPATSVNIVERLARRDRMPNHSPARRQWVIVLQGAMEIITDAGESLRLDAGDCVLAEDMDGVGHMTDDVGEQRLVTLTVGVPASWRWPGT
jgi:quercetin dioxygenase-like cupin family protein